MDIFTIYKLSTEELIRLGSVAGARVRDQAVHAFHLDYAYPVRYPRLHRSWSQEPGSTQGLGKEFNFCRRFWIPSCRIPPPGRQYFCCASLAGMNGAHAMVCSFSRAVQTWRHNRVSYAFAYALANFSSLCLLMGSAVFRLLYEYSFNTDEHGTPTSKRSDLHIRDDDGKSYILDLGITAVPRSILPILARGRRA